LPTYLFILHPMEIVGSSHDSQMTEDLRQRIEGNEHWGWILYRTFCTSTSDQHWGEVLKRLDGLILEDFDRMNIASTRDLVLAAAAAREKYQNVILDDEEKSNNASWELLETHFKEWVPTSSPTIFSRARQKCDLERIPYHRRSGNFHHLERTEYPYSDRAKFFVRRVAGRNSQSPLLD
jgi:hypothetical protein